MNRFIKTNEGYINTDQIASFRTDDNDNTVITLKNGKTMRLSGNKTGDILRVNMISDSIVVALDKIGTQLTLINGNLNLIESNISQISSSIDSVVAGGKYGDFVRIGGTVHCE
ncbi:hypothetical protein [Clostridium sp. Marseille-P299]|uniref:hypothetical protein n=1 Tax=Clostridium sp. Marseille-P299 TaxID=1805477 RepID=UPI0008300B5E|nr:hypothetical protein [Clostridium sp. Marseille-P299]